jgi:hypothetical protein
MSDPYWTDPDYLIYDASQEERADLLREELVNKRAMTWVAMDLDMGEEVIERLVDNIWNPLREMALDPETVDIVLELVLRGLADDERVLRNRILLGLEMRDL